MQNSTAQQSYRGNDRLLYGIILGVLAFWLFAQTTLNINVGMAKDLGMEQNMMNIAVSITSLFSGIFIVVLGGLADRIGRVKMIQIGFIFSIIGSALVAVTPSGALATPVLMTGRIFQGLSGAALMPASLALVKAYWDGAARQRAVSLWSIGSWGGSGFCALFGGLVASNLGWRYIFWTTVVISIIGFLMVKGTPESKGETKGDYKFDLAGVITFMLSIIGLQILLSKGSSFGWTSGISLGLFAAFMIFGFIFYKLESKNSSAFVDFKLFKNSTYTGATISNFLLNATAGILIVSLSLVQLGAGLTSQESGLLTLGYAIAIVSFIRVGEKLLQKFGARKPMIWGSLIVGLSIILLMQTQVMTDTYKILAMVSYTLFGLGLAFYATPSTDAALSNLPEDQAGAGAGIYKMASSLGAALGVAVSAAIFTALSGTTGSFEWMDGLISFVGRQDNLALRQGAMIALGVNLLMVVLAIISIVLTVPDYKKPAPQH
ncbi:MFS transporter [Kaistella faecalis]|uniref:MFS transporter n=1 Tax=Kaistella faecalis TaxID=2852098 RepID=UPI001C448455|nr:MFS transporter [Chryseobacterium faecale]UFK98286.1 MFS transporter [Chryseobacterium faecale]